MTLIHADEPLANRLPQDWREPVELFEGEDPFWCTRRPTPSGALQRQSILPRTVWCAGLHYRTDRTGD